MKWQVQFSLKNNEKYLRMPSAAVVFGTFMVITQEWLSCPIISGGHGTVLYIKIFEEIQITANIYRHFKSTFIAQGLKVTIT